MRKVICDRCKRETVDSCLVTGSRAQSIQEVAPNRLAVDLCLPCYDELRIWLTKWPA